MKGLLRKDFYVVRKNLLLMGLMFAIAGGFIAAITSPWILAILGAVMLGSVSVATIISDKSAQWDRFSASLPVAGRTVVSSKYLLYGLLSLAGLLLGTALAALLCLVLRSWDTELLWFQISVGITVSLLSGSISIPCGLHFAEEQATVAMMLSYAVTSAVFVGIVVVPAVLFQVVLDPFWIGTVGDVVGAAAFFLSWQIVSRHMAPYR